MREIKFRGIKLDANEFIYGDLLRFSSGWETGTTIQDAIKQVPIEVIPETIGQFTGLKDKNR